MGMFPDNGPNKLDFEKYDIGYEDYLNDAHRK